MNKRCFDILYLQSQLFKYNMTSTHRTHHFSSSLNMTSNHHTPHSSSSLNITSNHHTCHFSSSLYIAKKLCCITCYVSSGLGVAENYLKKKVCTIAGLARKILEEAE